MLAPRWHYGKETAHWCTAVYRPTQHSCMNTAPLRAGRMLCASAASPRTNLCGHVLLVWLWQTGS
ncbi:hypothetical protein E3U43_011235 [Larimichthys crocea]|uniref:Uncharacterized protein n=1 Tax=Larimichthys crocea TaxID=215358 RepID=A0ACD3QJB5_LARCR|nr:hypothetical protein E3U43_011235 [Larimichthys crocea]